MVSHHFESTRVFCREVIKGVIAEVGTMSNLSDFRELMRSNGRQATQRVFLSAFTFERSRGLR